MRNKAFTLAEVLVTLLVIGLVAAITIPTLFQSMQDKDKQVAYTKSVAILSEAIQLLAAKEIGCGTITDGADLAGCLVNVFISGTLINNGNTILASDGQTYTFYWRKDEDGVYTDCGEFPQNTEENWKGEDANCVVIIDIDGPHRGSDGYDDYSSLAAIDAPTGEDHFPMILTLHSVRPAFYVGSKAYEYTYGTEATADVKPWEDAEENANNNQNAGQNNQGG